MAQRKPQLQRSPSKISLIWLVTSSIGASPLIRSSLPLRPVVINQGLCLLVVDSQALAHGVRIVVRAALERVAAAAVADALGLRLPEVVVIASPQFAQVKRPEMRLTS